MHVVLAGGGTAGHIEPALALADALRRRDPSVGITALGTERGLEARLVPARHYDLALIPPVPLPRRPTMDVVKLPLRLGMSVRRTIAILDRVGADVVVGFGGYVAAPAYLAARRRRLPVVVHEANARPGLANRLGARFTRYVATSTPDTSLPHARYVGLPLRRAIATLDRAALRAEGRRSFGLDPDRPTLLVFGGSQGARRLNEAAAAAAPALGRAGIQVLHATGATSGVSVAVAGGGPPYVTVPYLDRMDLAYAAADLALCRAGALTCAELAAVGLPAIYVPLPHGNGEQELNARPVVRAGGGVLVRDEALGPEVVARQVRQLFTESDRLITMSNKAAGFGRRDADERLVEMVLYAAGERGSS